MSEEPKNSNNSNSPSNNKNVDLIKELTNNLQNNGNSIDLNSLVKIATPLLKNEAVMNSVLDISKKKQSSEVNSEISSTNEQIEHTLLKLEKLDQELVEIKTRLANKLFEVSISDEISTIKSELIELKKQNSYLTELVEVLYKDSLKNM